MTSLGSREDEVEYRVGLIVHVGKVSHVECHVYQLIQKIPVAKQDIVGYLLVNPVVRTLSLPCPGLERGLVNF